MIKVYTLTIAFNDATEEVEYIAEEVIEDGARRAEEYGSLDINKKEFWESISSEKAVKIMKEIAES